MNLKDLSSEQLRRIITIKQQIDDLEAELESIGGGPAGKRGPRGRRIRGRKMSASGRRAISLAAKKRWAAFRGGKPGGRAGKPPGKKKRKFSAAARAKLAAAAKARWAKVKAAGKKRL